MLEQLDYNYIQQLLCSMKSYPNGKIGFSLISNGNYEAVAVRNGEVGEM